jgi:hypothetical protein
MWVVCKNRDLAKALLTPAQNGGAERNLNQTPSGKAGRQTVQPHFSKPAEHLRTPYPENVNVYTGSHRARAKEFPLRNLLDVFVSKRLRPAKNARTISGL